MSLPFMSVVSTQGYDITVISQKLIFLARDADSNTNLKTDHW